MFIFLHEEKKEEDDDVDDVGEILIDDNARALAVRYR